MRMHTFLHLCCAVVTGDGSGGQIGADKGRLDFNLSDTQLDKEAIAAELNRLIAEDHPVAPRWISDAELAAQPELVSTMSVKRPSGGGRVRLRSGEHTSELQSLMRISYAVLCLNTKNAQSCLRQEHRGPLYDIQLQC